MKNLLSSFGILAAFTATSAFAQSGELMPADLPVSDPIPFVENLKGYTTQEHSLDVLLRHNGEAIVTGTVKVSNGTGEDIAELKLKPKSFKASRFDAYQHIKTDVCKNRQTGLIVHYENCASDDPAVFLFHSLSTMEGYVRLDPKLEGDTYVIKLFKPIEPGTSGRLELDYRGFGYVKKGLMGYRAFEVENFAAEDEISKVKVTVAVDTDLFFFGKRATIDFEESQFKSMPIAQGVSAGSAFGAVPEMAGVAAYNDSYVRRNLSVNLPKMSWTAPKEQKISKSAQLLAAGETIIVRGRYATNQWVLHMPKFLSWAVGLLIAYIILHIAHKLYRKRHPKQEKRKLAPVQASKSSQSVSANTENSIEPWELRFFSLFGALFAIAGSWISMRLIFFMVERISDSHRYLGHNEEIVILFALISIGFIAACLSLFAIPGYVTIKYSRKAALTVLGWELLFMLMAALMIVVFAIL